MSKKKMLNGKTLPQIMDMVEASEIDAFVMGLINSGEAKLRKVGEAEENYGRIGMASDPIKALAEVMGSNTQDALAEKLVQRTGVEPTSPRDVVEIRHGFPGGRFDEVATSSKAMQDALNEVEVTLRGHVPKGSQPHEATVGIRDKGVGVPSDLVAETICGLGGGKKTYKPYVAGSHGQGSKACYIFANLQKYSPGNTVQVVLTRHFESDELTLAIVWFDPREGYGPTGEVAKTGRYMYLVDPKTDRPWVFTAGVDYDFEPGTLVRIFAYRMGIQACAPFSAQGVTFPSLLNACLPDPLMPMRVSDARTCDKGDSRWQRYLKASSSQFNHTGAIHKLRRDGKVNASGEYRLPLGELGEAKLRWWVFDYDAGSHRIERYLHPDRPFLLTLNGQTHGELPKHLLTREAGLGSLNKRFLAIIDTDGLSTRAKRYLFNTNRETTRKGDELRALTSKIVSCLEADETLRKLNEEYQNRNSSESSEDEDRLLYALLSQAIPSVATYEGGTKKKKKETDDDEDEKEVTPLAPIPVSDPPTFFELKGPAQREIYAGRTFRVRVDTDAHPDLFDSKKTFQVDVPFSYVQYQGCTMKDGGRKSFLFKVEGNAPIGSEATLSLALKPSKGPEFVLQVDVQIEEYVKPPEDEGLPFEPIEVTTEEGLEAYELEKSDVAVWRQEASRRVMYVNMINARFSDWVEKTFTDGRLKAPEEVVSRLRVLYKAEAIISGYEAYIQEREKGLEPEIFDSMIRRGTKSAFSALLRTNPKVKDLMALGSTDNN